MVSELIKAGYRGGSRKKLINSVPLDILCDFIYGMVTRNMDGDDRKRFDRSLYELSTGRTDEMIKRQTDEIEKNKAAKRALLSSL